MGDIAILIPMMTLIGWTFAILIMVPFRCFRTGARWQVTADDFKYGESSRVPGEVSLPNRNFMNLLEVPVLFYLLCILQFVTKAIIPSFIYCAWLFVALRVAHSLIHVSYNDVGHRGYVFAASNMVVLFMWLRLFVAIAG